MNKLANRKHNDCNEQIQEKGFTLIETIIAGAILSMALVAVARMNISAITSSSQQADRQKIEAAISNNIQLLQQADSRLKLVDISDKEIACNNPGSYLMNELNNSGTGYYVPPPSIQNRSGESVLKRTMKSQQSPILTIISYQFKAPENDIDSETRVLKLYPNFHYMCGV